MDNGIKAIVFDLDGTLYTSRELAQSIHRSACSYFAEKRGISGEEAERLIRETKRAITEQTGFESSLSDACKYLKGDLAALHRRFATEINPAPFLTPDQQVVSMLARLKEQYRLCIFTNNNRMLTDKILHTLDIHQFFDDIFSIEDLWRPKPDMTALDRVLRAINLQPEDTLFVGDRYDIDLRLPASIGCQVYLSRSIDELLALETTIEKEML